MKRHILLFAVLACSIGTTFPGGGQSTPATQQITIATMELLEQRLEEAQKNNSNIAIDKDILNYFAGKSFTDADDILMQFDYIDTDIAVHHGKKYVESQNQRNRQLINKDQKTQLIMVLNAIRTSDDTIAQEQNRIRNMQPLIFELILQPDYPELYAQLQEKGKNV